jgi:hypothetical protein
MRPFLISLSAVAIACSGTDTTEPYVTPPPLPVLSIVAEMPLSMAIGTSATIHVTVRDTHGQEVKRALAFATSDSSVATVDAAGVIMAIGEGSALISVSSEGKSAEAVLHTIRPLSTTCREGFDFCVLNVYDLVSVNGEPLPIHSPWGIGDWDYDADAGTWNFASASLTLYRDGTFMYSSSHRAASGTTTYGAISGFYTKLGDLYLLTGKPAGSWEAHIEGGILTVDWEATLKFTFKARYPD